MLSASIVAVVLGIVVLIAALRRFTLQAKEGLTMNGDKRALGVAGLIAVLSVVLFSVVSIYACNAWFNVTDFTPQEGGKVVFNVGYGHRFPFGHSFLDPITIERVYMLASDGKELKVVPRTIKGLLRKTEMVSQVQFESVDQLKSGAYLLVLNREGYFWTYTDKGLENKSKDEVAPERITGRSFYAKKWAKGIVNVGEYPESSRSAIFKPLGHKLEIVPLKDPADLRTNDSLPVKVFFDGKPLGTFIYATYMGFSTEPDVFAYTAETSSKDGKGEIRILRPGIWKIWVEHKPPYPDPKRADEYLLQATLTFEVKP